ncbi:MAG: helix-turn-helix domain-containing protein [Clostridia bacterium]|nr:helix-turn-helix domain-containing protein [Clostridia bacterium]
MKKCEVEGIGRNIAALIKKSGMSYFELACASGISNTTISNYVKGRRQPTYKSLERLSNALGVKMDDILCGLAGAREGLDEDVEEVLESLKEIAPYMTAEQKEKLGGIVQDGGNMKVDFLDLGHDVRVVLKSGEVIYGRIWTSGEYKYVIDRAFHDGATVVRADDIESYRLFGTEDFKAIIKEYDDGAKQISARESEG